MNPYYTLKKTVMTSHYAGPGDNYNHGHAVVVDDLDDLVQQLNTRASEPEESVRRAFNADGAAVVFVIVGGKSVPLPFKRGDNIEGLLTQLRLILG